MTAAARYFASIKDDRRQWRDEQPEQCMKCRRIKDRFVPGEETVLWLETHEILSRAQAPNNWGFRANYLLLCHWCHPKVAGLSHAAQLAIKMRMDAGNYDLQEWLHRRNPNAMNYITEGEVRRAM